MSDFRYLLAKVISNGLRFSKSNHTPSVGIQCQTIADVSEKPDPSFVAGTMMYGDLYLSPDAIGRSYETLKSVFRWEGKSVADFNEPILAGKTVKLACSIDERTGKLKINFFNRPGAFKPMDKAELDELCSSVDALLNNANVAADEPLF